MLGQKKVERSARSVPGVDIKAVRPFEIHVTLDQIKADERLAEMILVRNSRLSVQPVSNAEWQTICALGKTNP